MSIFDSEFSRFDELYACCSFYKSQKSPTELLCLNIEIVFFVSYKLQVGRRVKVILLRQELDNNFMESFIEISSIGCFTNSKDIL